MPALQFLPHLRLITKSVFIKNIGGIVSIFKFWAGKTAFEDKKWGKRGFELLCILSIYLYRDYRSVIINNRIKMNVLTTLYPDIRGMRK
jgi:hypothetical protein